MTVYFYTLGCKVNQYETQAMRRIMEDCGYETAEYHLGQADVGSDAVIVINSCTVTGESDRKLRQLLRRCRRENPSAILVLTGCMPQAFPSEACAMTEADIVIGNAVRHELPLRIEQYRISGARTADVLPHTADYEPLSIDRFEGHTRAFVKIEDGCNRFCSYCIIPYARGRVRSRDLESLRREAETLAAAGYREIVLVGINLTAFGQDTGKTIADAVDCVAAVPGICRIRLGSLEPDYMTDEVIDRLSRCDKLCRQFHPALQSGCDATLRRMNRHYDTADFRRVCNHLREAFPGCALTTDVMVGFPGETEEEFNTSLAFVKEIGFARVHCFAYSRRPGTVADKAAAQVDNAVKDERSRRMIEVGEESRRRFAEPYLGQTVDVLLENRRGGQTEGYTDTYVPVILPAGEPGKLIPVKITAVEDGICYGERVFPYSRR